MTAVSNYLPPQTLGPAAQDLAGGRFVCMTTNGEVDYIGAVPANQYRILGVTVGPTEAGHSVSVATHPGDRVVIDTRLDTELKVGDVVVSDVDGKAKKAAIEIDADIILGIVLGPEKPAAQLGGYTSILMK